MTRTLAWDDENRLLKTTDKSGTNENITSYSYDAAGMRALKKGKYGTVQYVSDNYTVRNKDLISKHVFAGNTRLVSKTVMQEEKSGKTVAVEQGSYYYHADHLGSSSVVTDKAGKFYEQIEYFPYGETWINNKATAEQTSTPYKFTAKEYDEETGLYYYGARYYDAKLSRWCSADDRFDGLFSTQGQDVFAYVHGRPVMMIDPDGHDGHSTRSGLWAFGDWMHHKFRRGDADPVTWVYDNEVPKQNKLENKENLTYKNQVLPVPKDKGEGVLGSKAGRRDAIPEAKLDKNFHTGQDYKVQVGTPYLATDSGVVIEARFIDKDDKTTGEGNMIKYRNSQGDIVTGMHLSDIFVTKGSVINKGDVLGLTGNSGYWTSGPHLHESKVKGDNWKKVWSVQKNDWIDREWYDKETDSYKLY